MPTYRDAVTGYFTITGRINDVLNVSGHRMGTMEIESALVSCTELGAEAAVVGRPDDTTCEAICAFVVLNEKNGCLGCHAVAVEPVGPAYKDLTAKYADQPDATAVLATGIRAGGTGNWGQMPMPPQSQVSEADAKKLAVWISAARG